MAKNKALSIVFKVLFTLILVAIICFIFYNSSRIGSVSSGVSQQVMDKLNALLAKMGLSFQFSHTQIRKLGHFAEFALLGLWGMLVLRVYTKRVLAFISWPVLGGLLIAVFDEFFQKFVPGRTSDVTDVLIDFAGTCSGILVGLGLIVLANLISLPFRQKKRRRYHTS